MALGFRPPTAGFGSPSLARRVADAFRDDERATDAAGWAFNLAIFRIVYLSLGVLPLAVDTLRWMRRSLPGLHPDLWSPISFFRWLPLELITDPGLGQATAAILVALVVLGVLGYRTRVVLGIATLVALFALGLQQNHGKVHHYHNVVWFLAILAVSPSGAVLSLDAVLRRRNGGPDDRAPAGALAALRYIWALMGVLYLFPGLAKLAATLTSEWASAAHQRLVMWNKWWQLEWYDSTIRPILRADGLPDPVLTAGALAVIVFEVSIGTAMMFRRTRLLALVVGLGFHFGTGLVLGIWFAWLTPAYVGMIDWSRLVRWWQRGRDASAGSPGADRSSRPRGLHAVGIALIALEVVVSSMHLLTAIPHRYLPLQHRLVPFFESGRLRLLSWPFDAYPFFTTDGPVEVYTLELLVLAGDGRETPVPPAAFQAALRPSGAQGLARRVARVRDPGVQRTLSRHLAAAVWRHIPPEERDRAQGLRVYVSRFHVAATLERKTRTLLLDIPAVALDTTNTALRQ